MENRCIVFRSKLLDHEVRFKNRKLVLVGDFNLPGALWSNLVPDYADLDIILDSILFCGLKLVVEERSRVHRESCSILDLIFLSTSFTDYSIEVQNGISDHKFIYLNCYLTTPHINEKKEVCYVKDYARTNNESLLDYLELALDSFNDSNVEILWNKFKSLCER